MNALEALGVFGVLTPNNGTAGPIILEPILVRPSYMEPNAERGMVVNLFFQYTTEKKLVLVFGRLIKFY